MSVASSANVAITGDVVLGDSPLVLFAGPCVIESSGLVLDVASAMRELTAELSVPYVFKASFDKANRTSSDSFRSLGFEDSLEMLRAVRRDLGVPVVTDIHERWQVEPVSEVADVLQIPAFLCRQTDLLEAAGASGRVVNVKKGQFLAPEDMRFAAEKVRAAGGAVVLTERGTTFGYHDLVVDYRGLPTMRAIAPVIFDATHSVQSPGGLGGKSGGRRDLAPALARAAMAVGVDGLFVETHPDPDRALSDGPNMLPVDSMRALLEDCLAIRGALAAS